MAYTIRKACTDDFPKILSIFMEAIQILNANHIFQWDEIYPSGDVILDDIKKDQMYLLVSDEDILSALVINQQCDEEYKYGSWSCDADKSAIVHRLCVNPHYQNQGIGRQIMLRMEEVLLHEGYTSIRLDAFSLNPISLKLYDKLGYKKVGEVHFRKGICFLYEKALV